MLACSIVLFRMHPNNVARSSLIFLWGLDQARCDMDFGLIARYGRDSNEHVRVSLALGTYV
jgi:hypothetical protein